MSFLKIRVYENKDRKRWDQYILNHQRGTFFHLIGWKNTIEKAFGHRAYYLIAEEEISHDKLNEINRIGMEDAKKIVGILPLFSIKSIIFGSSLVSLPFAAYGGILADSDGIGLKLLNKARDIAYKLNSDYLELRHRGDGLVSDLPVKSLYYTFSRVIYSDVEKNFMAIPRKARRMIRQGEKNNLKYRFGKENLLRKFYEIFARSYHNLGTPVFSLDFFKSFIDEFPDNYNILIVSSSDGKDIAGVMSFYYKKEVLPYYAGSLFEYRNLAPNDFMYWQLMKYGCEKGYSVFDFGRSKINTGSFDFKRHWGFDPELLSYQFFLNNIKEIPNISPLNPKYRKFIAIWKRIPFWTANLIGPQIVKYIP